MYVFSPLKNRSVSLHCNQKNEFIFTNRVKTLAPHPFFHYLSHPKKPKTI